VPSVVLVTVKVPVTFPVPAGKLHGAVPVKRPVGAVVIPQVVSVTTNPVPETVTKVPSCPEVGESVIVGVGVVTVNVAVAKSPFEPVSVTVYVPNAAVDKTVKELELNRPFVRVHDGAGVVAMISVGVLVK
jgi:hypothetical protein